MRFFVLFSMLSVAAGVSGQPLAAIPMLTVGSPVSADLQQEYTRHRIRKGDTYIKLSREYYGTDKYWQAIKRYNGNLPDKNLKPNQFLKIPQEPGKVPAPPPDGNGGAAQPKPGQPGSSNPGGKGKGTFETLGDVYYFLAGKVERTLVNLKLSNVKVVSASVFIFVSAFVYLITDVILLLPAFVILRMKDDRPIINALRISGFCFIMQAVLIVCGCLIVYLVLDNSASWSLDTLLGVKLNSGTFMGSAITLSLLCFLFIPFGFVKTSFALSPLKTLLVVTLPFILKTIVSTYPVLLTYLVTDYSTH